MTTTYNDLRDLLNEYGRIKGYNVNVESDLQTTSQDTTKGYSFSFSENHKIIDMDIVAHQILVPQYFNGSTAEHLAQKSVDAFMISKKGTWYFIEFKNQKIGKAKDSANQKAYQNLYWLINIIFEMRENGRLLNGFDYDNPTKFVKENCKYYLVLGKNFVSEELSQEMEKYKQATLAKMPLPQKHSLLFMQKLANYVYKDAKVFEETVFDEAFVKRFV